MLSKEPARRGGNRVKGEVRKRNNKRRKRAPNFEQKGTGPSHLKDLEKRKEKQKDGSKSM